MLCFLSSTTAKTITLFVCEKGTSWGLKFVICTACTHKPRASTNLSSSSCVSMSITYCLLVFIIMGLSLHLCDGRHLMDMDKKPVKRTTSSSKVSDENHCWFCHQESYWCLRFLPRLSQSTKRKFRKPRRIDLHTTWWNASWNFECSV